MGRCDVTGATRLADDPARSERCSIQYIQYIKRVFRLTQGFKLLVRLCVAVCYSNRNMYFIQLIEYYVVTILNSEVNTLD